MADTKLTTQDTAIKKESNGTITFANEVIATIAGLAAVDIPGVAGMTAADRADGVTQSYSEGKTFPKASELRWDRKRSR